MTYSERSAFNGYDRRTAHWRPLSSKKLKAICDLPGGCQHGHPSTGGVQFITVRVDEAPTRLCGGCWEALAEKVS
mgnify:CR=1 FL=1